MEAGKIKILLLVVRNRRSYRLFEEIGVCCLAAYLRQFGHEVKLMEEYEDSMDFSAIQSFAPRLIGMPVYALTEQSVYRVCRELKQRIPDVSLCLGGYSPTARGDRMMKLSPDIDFIIRGEGERPLKELADRLAVGQSPAGVRGLTWRRGDQIESATGPEQIRDIGELPWPARDFLREKGYDMALVMTSRGCNRNCSFCVTKQIWKRWRSRDLRDAVDEIEHLAATYGIRSFFFIDCSYEDPNPADGRIRRLAEEILHRRLGITYSAYFRSDFHRMADPSLMDLLGKSGLISALIGVESANPHGLRVYNKRSTPEDNRKVIELFRSWGINVDIGFIMFNPYATFAGMRQDVDFLEEYGFAFDMTTIATQYAMSMGCALDRRILRDGLLLDEDDPYGYRFADERLGMLAGYIREFNDRLRPDIRIPLLRVQQGIINLAYWRRMFSGDRRAHDAILAAERDCCEIREALNHHTARWFRTLLDLAETSWEVRKADRIREESLSDRFILDAHRQLERHKEVLQSRLQQFGYTIRKMGSSGSSGTDS
jgi:anaerobic magnesium-protoporphyrin IX monomethyl ester cyclase